MPDVLNNLVGVGGLGAIIAALIMIIRDLVKSKNGNNGGMAKIRMDDFVKDCFERHKEIAEDKGKNDQRFEYISEALKTHGEKLDTILANSNGCKKTD